MSHLRSRPTPTTVYLGVLFFTTFVVGRMAVELEVADPDHAAPCEPGLFGPPACQNVCHCKAGGEVCDPHDGKCTRGMCSPGWKVPPLCQTVCPKGRFGLSCNLYCHCPASDVCDNVNGLCASQKCRHGWTGPSCQIGLPVFSAPPRVTETTPGSVNIQWRKWSRDRDLGQGPVDSYKLQMEAVSDDSDWQEVRSFPDTRRGTYSYVVSSLVPASEYRFRIILVALVGGKPQLSVPSPATSAVRTQCGKPKASPRQLSGDLLLDTGYPSLHLIWQPPPRSSWQCKYLASYEARVTCKPRCGECVLTTSASTNYATLAKLPEGAEITVKVRVINTAGLQGPWSSKSYFMVPTEPALANEIRRTHAGRKDGVYFLLKATRNDRCPSTTLKTEISQNNEQKKRKTTNKTSMPRPPTTTLLSSETRIEKDNVTKVGGGGGAIYIKGIGVSPWVDPEKGKIELDEDDEGGENSYGLLITVLVVVLAAVVGVTLLVLYLLWRRHQRQPGLYRNTLFQPSTLPSDRAAQQSPFTGDIYKPATAMRMLDHSLRASPHPHVPADNSSPASRSSDRKSIQILTRDLRSYMKQRQASSFSLEDEFKSLPVRLTEEANIGSLAGNAIYNRSSQVVPYDRNRVKLEEGNGYINASQVKSVNNRLYLVSQTPLANTVVDFWVMVWEQHVNLIVMLMDADESYDDDCAQYWPRQGERDFQDIRVTLLKDEATAHYTVRVLEISRLGHTDLRLIHHYQYRCWSQGGVPLQHYSFLDFVNLIHREKHPKHSVLVHCQTGGGRSGLYVALDSLLQEGRRAGKLDVLRCVTALRMERPHMVHSARQYVFLHQCLADAFDHPDTDISAGKLSFAYRNLLNVNSNNCRIPLASEFYDLEANSLPRHHDPWKQNSIFVSPAITRDSLTMSQLPGSPGGVLCMAASLPAICADSYRTQDAFLLMQSPPVESYASFWRLLYENDVRTVVMLDAVGADCPDYLPVQEGEDIVHGEYSLLLRKLVRTHDNVIVCDLGLSCLLKGGEQMRQVKYFRFTGWPFNRAAPSLPGTVALLVAAEEWLRTCTRRYPLAVHGGSGLNRPALFLALWHLSERADLQSLVDVYATVRYIREIIPTAFPDLAQYRFLHEAMTLYLRQRGVIEDKIQPEMPVWFLSPESDPATISSDTLYMVPARV